MGETPMPLWSLMEELPGESDLWPAAFEPRLYQQRIIRKTISLFQGTACDAKGNPEPLVSSILVESPTGSGKTIVGLAIARWMQTHLNMRVGWTAIRRNLLAQAAAENGRGFGVDLQLISMFDKHPPQVELLIIDEAQHDGALSMANMHGIIKPKKILGLSATPFRSDRFKLCFEKSIRDAGIHALIQDGYLSPYHHYTIPRYTPVGVAEAYVGDAQRWGKSLIFFHTLAECRECQRELAERGVAAELVTAKSERERQIAEFSAGRARVMINMMILSEGFDCPSLQTVFCRPSGRLCTVQMGGRVFRKHPELSFKQVVQCAQTRHPFPRTATPVEQYLWSETEGAWRSLKLNRQIDAMTARMQSLIAASRSELPKLLGKAAVQMMRGRRRWGDASENVF
jgi:superfamily II DNA or RNA helicase